MQDFSRLYYPGVGHINIEYITQGRAGINMQFHSVLPDCFWKLLLSLPTKVQVFSAFPTHPHQHFICHFPILPYCWVPSNISLLGVHSSTYSEVKHFSFLFLAEEGLFCEFSVCILSPVFPLSFLIFLLLMKLLYIVDIDSCFLTLHINIFSWVTSLFTWCVMLFMEETTLILIW